MHNVQPFVVDTLAHTDINGAQVCNTTVLWGHEVAQLVEALRYKLEGGGFDPRWCQWNFSLT